MVLDRRAACASKRSTKDGLILYGGTDLLNHYVDIGDRLRALDMTPLTIRRFRSPIPREDVDWAFEIGE